LKPVDDMVNESLAAFLGANPLCPEKLLAAMSYSLLAPGKRLRPRLVLCAAECCGSTYAEALPAACAIEMVHAYSLIHDDLPAMDDDDLRRGRPSCHIAFGEAMAILAGDALVTLAFQVLATAGYPAATGLRCVAELAQAAGWRGMVGGQAADLFPDGPRDSLSYLESVHARKTGALIQASVRLGGIVAGAGDDDLRRLSEYGTCLGMAFQIVDDLLDETGDEHIVGKRTRKDVERGKRTFPQLMGIEPARARARSMIDQAISLLSPFEKRAERLRDLAAFVIERDK
jgi:geranylgeranyl diphosphate synthase type II